MALDSDAAFVETNDVAFPDNEAVNASGPTATDGTEFVKLMIDNYMFGRQQALLNYAGLVPDGFSEADGASQELDALKLTLGAPGESVNWYGNTDPAVSGARILLLNGQGVLVADFPELEAATYVGDGNNATADGFFKADDAAGSVRNTAGIWFILPDGRGQALRGMDPTATIDPDGASRLPGDIQLDQLQGHFHAYLTSTTPGVAGSQFIQAATGTTRLASVTGDITAPIDDGTNGVPRAGIETRMTNMTVFFGIRF